MAVRIRVAPHPDLLVGLLCDELAHPVGGLFDLETVAVPSRGIERWLTQQIASGMAERGAGDGICANVEFPSPRDLIGRVVRSVPGLADPASAWEGPALTARLLDVIDLTLGEPWMAVLARHLDVAGGSPGTNRMTAAAKLARLFTAYARRRPDMIRAWRDGSDQGPDTKPLGADHAWQARLWRVVREAIGLPSLPELVPAGLDPLRNGEVEVALPERVSVYGLTSLDPLDLGVLTALGHRRQVTLYVLHPSPALWRQVEATLSPVVLPERIHDPTAHLPRHPLLRAWGRDSRELQTVLASGGLGGEAVGETAEPETLLARIQADLGANRPPERDRDLSRRVAARKDRSVQIHVCHGARRQAEVIRDAILHLLVNDPRLEPRDVVIMTPDLATFAPLLEAAFPDHEGSGLPDLRLRIADRSPAATNPLVSFTAWLLEAVGSRLPASVVRDLVDRPVVQEKFGFDSDTAGSIVSLVDDSNVAWGIDEEHRAEWGVHSTERTWRRALDRTLAGVFYADDPVTTVGGLSPLEGVEGQDAVPAGILAGVLDRLVAIRAAFSRPRPMSEWPALVAGAVRMLAAPSWGEEWQLTQLERLLTETFPAPEEGAPDPEVSLAEALRAVRAWSDDRPSPLHFRTGDITVCTLVPMRSVPYRVVALIGMDEDRFPRRGRDDGDDLLADHELLGDTDPDSQDRQLLLDAVLAAGDHLLISYSGADELTNAPIPPAVPVAEMVDLLGEMVDASALAKVETRHPLQSFSEANFFPGDLGEPGPWGFDTAQFAGALALQQRTFEPPPPPAWPEPPEEESVRLGDLIEFLQGPVRRFVKARLGFKVPESGGLPNDTIPADLGGLELWSLKHRLLQGLVAGYDPDALRERERGSDTLPPGRLGDDDLAAAMQAATTLWSAARERGYDPRRHQPFAGIVDTGRGSLEGTVNADPVAEHLATVTPSELNGRRRVDAWARLLFLSAHQPDRPWTALLLGRKGGRHAAVTIGPLPGGAELRQRRALELLGDLLDLYREGHRRPLPLPCETSYVWQRAGGADAGTAWRPAKEEFERRFGEASDAAHMMVLPEIRTFRDLEESEFSQFCARLWLPILSMSGEKTL